MSRLVRGISVNAAGQAAGLAMQLAGDVALARLLGPEQFGLYLAVFVFVGFAMQFRDVGLSAATIQSRTMTEQQGSNLHWLNFGIGAALTALFALTAPLVGMYYGSDSHARYALALSACFVIAGYGVQFQARLTKEHRFGALTSANLLSILAYYLSAIAMAALGYGVWALVWSLLLRHLVRTLVLQSLSGWRPLPFRKGAGIRGHLKFGGHVAGFDIINYASRNVDNLLVGAVHGSHLLGIYNRAYQVMLFPITQLRGPLVAAGLPSLSDDQNDDIRHKAQFLWIVRALATCAMPVALFTGFYAQEIIDVVFGPAWTESGAIVARLAPAAVVQPTCGLLGLYLISKGRSDRYFRWGLAYAAATISSIALSVKAGVPHMATTYSIVQIAIFAPSAAYCLRGGSVGARDFLAAHLRPLLASSAAMAVALLFTWQARALELAPGAALVAAAAVFGLAYALPVWLARAELIRHEP